MVRLSQEQAEGAFSRLAKDFDLIAPRLIEGEGRLSDTDVVTYEQVNSISQIEFHAKTFFSAKSAVFPTRETMFSSPPHKKPTQPGISSRPMILFLRSCDIHALDVLDSIFLESGGLEDPYYKARRQNIRCFLLECHTPFPDCFCVSMGTSETKNYCVFVRPEEGEYAFQIRDDKFDKYFTEGTETFVEPRSPKENHNPVPLPKVEDIDNSLFENEIWKQYTDRCIACGRCNTSCPTCSCFSIQDIKDTDSSSANHRRRIWSSCQVKNFGLLAGGHDFRLAKGDRMRYKVLHKIRDFPKRFGRPMCVGCGRCDEVCPEYISMARCVKTIHQVIVAGGKR